MCPKKRTKHVNWPKYVSVANGRVVSRPRVSVTDFGKSPTAKYGYLKPPIKLGKIGDPDEEGETVTRFKAPQKGKGEKLKFLMNFDRLI